MPHPFSTGQQLLDLCEQTGLSIAQLMMANEAVLAPIEQVRQGVLPIADIMNACIDRGCGYDNHQADQLLPGGLKVRRRAPALYREIQTATDKQDVVYAMELAILLAMAVKEDNEARGE